MLLPITADAQGTSENVADDFACEGITWAELFDVWARCGSAGLASVGSPIFPAIIAKQYPPFHRYDMAVFFKIRDLWNYEK